MLAIATLIASSFGTASAAMAASRPVVLELFTSQGCSSCPPADALLVSLASRRDLLPLAFHVTYWNALGWRDPFSSDLATQRQARYAAQLGGGSYTPEMVIDGARAVVGSDVGEVSAGIAASRPDAANALSVRIARSDQGVDIAVDGGEEQGEILLVGFDPRHETKVGRGENTGRTLLEANIVRSARAIGEYTGHSMRVSVPRGAGAEAAVIVQARNGRILGAARL